MSKELKVGVFVLVSLLIFLGTLVYVDQLGGLRVPYKTYFKYAGGVDPGSQVRFGGMKVGSITAIREWREDPTKIEILMEVKGGVPVNADSVATLTSLSPLGDKYLEISTGSNHARRLSPGATIPSTEPVSFDELAKQASELLPTVKSTLQDVQRNIDQLSGNAQIVLSNFQSMTSPQNQRNFTLLLANARGLLDKESAQIDRVLHNLDRASAQASGTLDQANRALNQIQTAARTANDTFATANRTIGEIRDPIKTDLAQLQKTMAELQKTMTDARHLIADLNTVVSANRYNIDASVENFRAASENLRELTMSVRQQPSILIRGKPAPDRAVPVATRR
jgi:phospholipid/cholesterol/gamma-HCH transport system substrate-binding protein